MSTSPALPAHGRTDRGLTARGARADASPIPLIVAIAASVASVGLAVVLVYTASAPVAVLGIRMPLANSGAWWISLIGYILTPIAVVCCYGWDITAQRDGSARNREFVFHPAYTRALQIVSGISLVIGLWHVLNLSVFISEWLRLS